MSKCPNCSNTISSIDVLCPKCGALVEQINTNVAPKIKATEVPKESEAENTDEVPNRYENLIVYNESYQIDEAPIPDEPTPVELPTVQDDFEIDNIIASANSAPRVNPLFAHIEKHRHDDDEAAVPEDESTPTDGTDADTVTTDSEEPPKQDESDNDDIAQLEEDASANEVPPIEEDALAQTVPEEDTPADIEAPVEVQTPTDTETPLKDETFVSDETPVEAETFTDSEISVEDTTASANISPNEREISKESAANADVALPSDSAVVNSEPMEAPAKDSLDVMPAYSKDYLDALRNIELVEDKLEIDEEFDPEAFMAKFKKNANTEPSAPNDSAEPDSSEQPLLAIFESDSKFNNVAKAPPKRRYNPNRVKPLEEKIAVPVVAPAAPTQSAETPTQAVQAPAETVVAPVVTVAAQAETVSTPAETVVAPAQSKPPEKPAVDTTDEDTSRNKVKTKAPDDEPLELTLTPDKFFDSDASAEGSNEDEVFVFGEESDEVEVLNDDEQIIRNASKNPYSAAITKPDTKEHKATSKMKETQELKAYKLKRLPIWVAILIWVAVTAGVFFGAYSLDKHVNSNYSGYSEYLYEITDGKIDIETLIN